METPYPGDCAECAKPLLDYEIKHGWVTIDVGYRRPPARVHTICRSKFTDRPLAEQQERADKVEIRPESRRA